jgi:DNA-directed RNA polymerase specialized sigma24 family protein
MPHGSFEEFVRASLPALTRYAFTLTGTRADAEDLLQDTLIKVSRAWRRVRSDGNLMAYTRTTMLHLSVSAWRATVRRPRSVPLTDERATAGPARRFVDRHRHDPRVPKLKS